MVVWKMNIFLWLNKSSLYVLQITVCNYLNLKHIYIYIYIHFKKYDLVKLLSEKQLVMKKDN